MSLPSPREQNLVKPALQLLALRGIFAWRNNTGAVRATNRSGKERFIRFSTPGASDLLGILPGGRFLAVEPRSPSGKVTQAQRSFLDRVTAAGGVALVISDLAELERELARLIAGGAGVCTQLRD